MVQLSVIRPLDQPQGLRRLLQDLKTALAAPEFTSFRLAVAFAKSGPLLRMKALLEQWRAEGKRIEGIFGVDHQGTSRQALELAIQLFDEVYYTREPGFTFHPKIYLFEGKKVARCLVGSNNLTVGGTETNFEASICIDLELPDEKHILTTLKSSWTDLLPANCPATKPLDLAALKRLISLGLVPDETVMRSGASSTSGSASSATTKASRSGLVVKPPSPLPRGVLKAGVTNGRTSARSPVAKPTVLPTTPANPLAAQSFAIQVKPHDNGEIFLSVTAALQNPSFFRWPFNGSTTPKKPSNPSYPQLTPDPIVNVTVYGAGSAPILTLSKYHLNTVYYSTKSEIRITASPLVSVVPDYSVMIMSVGEEPGIDYEIVVHRPDSPDYGAWVTACNQSMPGGGQAPRKFGWF